MDSSTRRLLSQTQERSFIIKANLYVPAERAHASLAVFRTTPGSYADRTGPLQRWTVELPAGVDLPHDLSLITHTLVRALARPGGGYLPVLGHPAAGDQRR